jgi:hypothetical protein
MRVGKNKLREVRVKRAGTRIEEVRTRIREAGAR